MPGSKRSPFFKGFNFDKQNGRYEALFNNTEVFDFDANDLTTASGITVDLSASTVTLPTRTAFIDVEPAVVGADGAALAASETAGDFARVVGTNQIWIQGEEASNETEVSVGYFPFVLPENYVSGGTITISAFVDVQGAGTLGSCTIDFEAYKMTLATGAVGSDLVTTAAQAINATGAEKTFTVTPTGLVAGDKLVVKMTTSVVESAATAIRAVITRLGVTVQVNK